MLDYCLTPVMFFHHNDALTVYISLCTTRILALTIKKIIIQLLSIEHGQSRSNIPLLHVVILLYSY